jgi:uncharacterized protein YecT (DUF1311 family)
LKEAYTLRPNGGVTQVTCLRWPKQKERSPARILREVTGPREAARPALTIHPGLVARKFICVQMECRTSYLLWLSRGLHMHGRNWLAVPLFAFLTAPCAHAQQNWCSNPRTPDEITICGNSALSQFDRQLGQLYIAVRTGLSLDQQSLLRDTQRAWLSQRSACGWNADCIARLYQTRIPQLRGMLAGGAPLPSTGSAPAATPAPVPTPTGSGRDACDMFPTLCPPGR